CPTGQNCTHGNPNLAPEESFGINLSVGGSFDLVQRALNWQLSTWDRRVDNLITTAAIPAELVGQFPEGFTRTFINLSDEAKVTGVEALLNGEITRTLSFDVSYTYSKEVDRVSKQQ